MSCPLRRELVSHRALNVRLSWYLLINNPVGTWRVGASALAGRVSSWATQGSPLRRGFQCCVVVVKRGSELPGWMLAILIEIASKLLGNVFEIDGLTWSTLAITGGIGRKLLGNIFW